MFTFSSPLYNHKEFQNFYHLIKCTTICRVSTFKIYISLPSVLSFAYITVKVFRYLRKRNEGPLFPYLSVLFARTLRARYYTTKHTDCANDKYLKERVLRTARVSTTVQLVQYCTLLYKSFWRKTPEYGESESRG